MALTDITNPAGAGTMEMSRGDVGTIIDICALAQVCIEMAVAIGGGSAGDFVFVG